MVDALNVVVHEIAEYRRAIELSQKIEKKILEMEAEVSSVRKCLGKKCRVNLPSSFTKKALF